MKPNPLNDHRTPIGKKAMAKAIRKLRPRLSEVAPLSSKTIFGFGLLNLLMGLYLYTNTGQITSRLAVVNGFFTLHVYALVFTALGCVMLWAYYVNDWKIMKNTLLVGLALKAIWLFALFMLAAQGGNWFVLMLWSFITYVQASTYIHFIPNGRRAGDE